MSKPDPDCLEEDSPLWCVNEQIKDMLEGGASSEDHRSVIEFLRSTGLPEGTAARVHLAIVCAERKLYAERAMRAPLEAVIKERERQNLKWGEQNHDPITWSAILSEECGEFAQAALRHKFGGPAAAGLREEAIQCAAVALQIVECLDRNAEKSLPAEPHGHP
jgi:NTP pyrophosphatase (non-canonical NTP hydrolase)